MRDSQRLDLLFFLSLKVRILKVRVLEWGGERGGVDSALEESSDKEDAGEEFATESMRDQWYPE